MRETERLCTVLLGHLPQLDFNSNADGLERLQHDSPAFIRDEVRVRTFWLWRALRSIHPLLELGPRPARTFVRFPVPCEVWAQVSPLLPAHYTTDLVLKQQLANACLYPFMEPLFPGGSPHSPWYVACALPAFPSVTYLTTRPRLTGS
jgi:hypothetical protein